MAVAAAAGGLDPDAGVVVADPLAGVADVAPDGGRVFPLNGGIG